MLEKHFPKNKTLKISFDCFFVNINEIESLQNGFQEQLQHQLQTLNIHIYTFRTDFTTFSSSSLAGTSSSAKGLISL